MDKNGPPTAVVTGASRGLGRALARELATRGWRLVIDARGAADLEEAAREIAQAGPASSAVAGAAPLGNARAGRINPLTAITGDVADPIHREALIAAAGPRIDLLVNNASTLGPSPLPPMSAYSLDELENVYRVNVLAPLALTQLALPHMRDRSTVINVSSDAAVEPYEGWGGYGSSKAALDRWTLVLAAERPDLRVFAVDPGDMRTQMHQDAFPGEDISDRPPPEASVPGLIALIEGAQESGRVRVADLIEAPA